MSKVLRRVAPLALALGVLAGACGQEAPPASSAVDPALGNQAPIDLGFQPSAQRPMRVMLWGDSVLFTIEPSLVAGLQATKAAKVFPQAFPGWGLTTDPRWRKNLGDLLAEDRPDLILAMWVWDQVAAREHPVRYDAQLRAFVERALEGRDAAKGLVLLDWPKLGDDQVPMAGDGTYPERDPAGHQAWLASARRVAARYPGRVVVADLTAPMLLRGRPAIWLPPATDPDAPPSRWVRARHDDAVHVCAEGATRFSARLLVLLHRMVALPLPAATWRGGEVVPTSRDALWQAVVAQQQADAEPSSRDCPRDHPPGGDNGRTP